MVNEFIARVFSGSAKPLLVHLVDDTTLDQDEVAEIEARVKEKRDKSRPSGSAGAKAAGVPRAPRDILEDGPSPVADVGGGDSRRRAAPPRRTHVSAV